MSFSVREISPDKEIKKFLKVANEIYKNDPYWITPLFFIEKKTFDRKKNPFNKHRDFKLFIADENNKPVGRIGACVDELFNSTQNMNAGFFGFFESIDNIEVAKSLFNVAEDWLRSKNLDTVFGPINFSTNESCALLIDGFEKPTTFMMPYNPQYYCSLIEQCGYSKVMDMYAWNWNVDVSKPSEKIKDVVEKVRQSTNVKIRTSDVKNLKSEMRILLDIYNDAWSQNWGFTPLTEEEVDYMAKEFKMLIRPELFFFLEIDSKPVGFSFIIPDLNVILKSLKGKLFPFGFLKLYIGLKKIKRGRCIVLGVKKEFQQKGLGALLAWESMVRGTGAGFEEGELSWTLENNYAVNKTIQEMGGIIYKKYRMFTKKII